MLSSCSSAAPPAGPCSTPTSSKPRAADSPPGGDTARRAGNTPFLKLNSRHFMAVNRGKRGMTVDITKPDGAQIVRDLATHADVLVENFRPGVMERLGIGYEQLSALNPRLIYA